MLIVWDDWVVLIDFGVVKDIYDVFWIVVGIVVGILSYVVFEQLFGEVVGSRMDLFGLGGILYYMFIQWCFF